MRIMASSSPSADPEDGVPLPRSHALVTTSVRVNEQRVARGFLPTVTRSAHWLAHPAFADAVGHFLDNEKNSIHAYVDELREHNPFKG